MSDAVTLKVFVPKHSGSDLFVWDQALVYAEQQFVLHPGVTVLKIPVKYFSGVRVEEFRLGECSNTTSTVGLMGLWAGEVGVRAEREAVRAREQFEGWASREDG